MPISSWGGGAGGGVSLPDGLALGVGVPEAHLLQLAAAVELVVARVRLLPQVLHVDADQHLPQLHAVAVALVLHWGGEGGQGHRR